MKSDITIKFYKKVFKIEDYHKQLNEEVKAVIINFGDDRGDIIVNNDNFGTRRKYMDFTEGKKAAGLHPLQIVYTCLSIAIESCDRYIDKDGKEQNFKDWN